jgi:hypothetical protein
MQRIWVDYNDYNDPYDKHGEPGVRVGFEDAWQLVGYDLREGLPALFVAPDDLEMGGTLRGEMLHGKMFWYGALDPATTRHYVRADLSAEAERVAVTERHELMTNFRDGERVVLCDQTWEVYGTLVRTEDGGHMRWGGRPDWSTRRSRTELPEAAWKKYRELERARQHP